MPFYRRPDGCRLYHEVHGPESGEPLVLLEGLGGDIPGWRRNIPVGTTGAMGVGAPVIDLNTTGQFRLNARTLSVPNTS